MTIDEKIARHRRELQTGSWRWFIITMSLLATCMLASIGLANTPAPINEWLAWVSMASLFLCIFAVPMWAQYSWDLGLMDDPHSNYMTWLRVCKYNDDSLYNKRRRG